MQSILVPLVAAALLSLPSLACAHALGADCKLKDGKVNVETFYDDDTPAIGALVLVTGAQQKTLAQGKTDAKGIYTFDAPPPGVYEVTVDAGAGHRTRCKLTIPDPKSPPVSDEKKRSDPAPPESETKVSDGPGRAEATRFPWLRLLLGLAVIACAAGLWKLATTRR